VHTHRSLLTYVDGRMAPRRRQRLATEIHTQSLLLDRAAAAKAQLVTLKASGQWPDAVAGAPAMPLPTSAVEPITNRQKRRLSLNEDTAAAAAVVLRRASTSHEPGLPPPPEQDVC